MTIRESVDRSLSLASRGLMELQTALDGPLGDAVIDAVNRIVVAQGRVIVTGMGKSGHIGVKIAATLSSTGTPAYFVHPSEASHGDLGMITPGDLVLALSWSGETVELTDIVSYTRRFKVPLIAITGRQDSALGRAADVCLQLPLVTEACPHGLAPTTSTMVQLALGDCLAVALLEARGFTAQDFRAFHPGGSLGGRLKLVGDLMHTGDRLPLAPEDELMSTALITMSSKSFGCLGVINADGLLSGIVTDGDLRRNMQNGLLSRKVVEVMTRAPKTITPGVLAASAIEILNAGRVTALFVVEQDRPVGILHIHDLLRAGVA